jgi:diacylglycerol kinase family enzyme
MAEFVDQGEVAAGRPVSVVLNGAAGALLAETDAHESLGALLREAGFAPDFVPVEAGTLPERMAAACKAGGDLVIVGGGDGTIACAAGVAAAAGVILGILPFGTMNVLARDVGIPVGDTAAAVKLLSQGVVREIDAAEVNGKLYLCNSMLGLPARLARFREAGRGRGLAVRLWLRLARAAHRGAAHYGAPRMKISIDGKTRTVRAASTMVSVNPLDDSAGRLFARSTLDSGRLAVYLTRRFGLLDMARFAARSLLGHLHDDPRLEEIHAEGIEIHAFGRRTRKAIRVMNDGEIMLMEPPLVYRVRPRALRIMAPAAAPAGAAT